MPLPILPSLVQILVVEDEEELLSMLKGNFEREGYAVRTATDGIPALALHRQAPSNLIILDLMLPHMDGFRFLKNLRESGDEVPVLLLTARGEEKTKLQGFELGADDYLTKPFSILELLSRVKAILRRAQKDAVPPGQVLLASGPYTLDREKLEFCRGKKKLEIGLQGFRILELLLLRPGHVHGREEIINLAWVSDAKPSSDRTVDVHIYAIRKALGSNKDWLATIEGVGYRWAHPVEQLARP